MERLIIDVDSAANAELLIQLMKGLGFVRSISSEGLGERTLSDEMDWVRPGHPASDEAMEQMVAEAAAEYETGRAMPIAQAKTLTLKKFAAWKKENGL